VQREAIVESIKQAIIRGRYRDGQRLVEKQLCEEFGVKRYCVREALKALANLGFVVIVPYQGAIVSTLTSREIAHIYDTLGSLEGLSMRAAMPSITGQEIARIESLIEKIEKNQDNAPKIYEFNRELHRYMTELGDNQVVIPFVESLRSQAQRISMANFEVPEQIPVSLIEHRHILDAVKAGEPFEVERQIINHYITARDLLIKALIYGRRHGDFAGSMDRSSQAGPEPDRVNALISH